MGEADDWRLVILILRYLPERLLMTLPHELKDDIKVLTKMGLMKSYSREE